MRVTNGITRAGRNLSARLMLSTLFALGALTLAGCDDSTSPELGSDWRPGPNDASPHREGHAASPAGATVHYLDWGGTGAPLVLLAGAGENAHVFDDIGPKLARRYRVIAITRRGYGQSSRPTSNYGVDYLVDDAISVVDKLKLPRFYLGGHSIGAREITRLAVRYPQRVARLVYIDGSMDDRTQECRTGIAARAVPGPEDVMNEPDPTEDDMSSWSAFVRFRRSVSEAPWTAAREQSLWRAVKLDEKGRVSYNTDLAIHEQMMGAACRYRHEFSALEMPALSIGAVPGTVFDALPWLPDNLSGDSLMIAQYVLDMYQHKIPTEAAAFKAEAPFGSAILIQNTNHYVFVKSEALVIAALREFLPAKLPEER